MATPLSTQIDLVRNGFGANTPSSSPIKVKEQKLPLPPPSPVLLPEEQEFESKHGNDDDDRVPSPSMPDLEEKTPARTTPVTTPIPSPTTPVTTPATMTPTTPDEKQIFINNVNNRLREIKSLSKPTLDEMVEWIALNNAKQKFFP